MPTVKITDQAKADAVRMNNMINTEMPNLINQMNTIGQQMADPQNWDGPLALQYRGQVWPDARNKLQAMRNSLSELQQSVRKVMDNISHAGGA
jgi:hypothetical protein